MFDENILSNKNKIKKLQALSLQLYYKETPTQVFSCEISGIFKSTYFEEHLRTTASSVNIFLFNIINWALPT